MEHVVVVDAVLAGARLDVHFTRYAGAGASSTCVDGAVAAQSNTSQHQLRPTDSSPAAWNIVRNECCCAWGFLASVFG